jgi:hypothetical protein
MRIKPISTNDVKNKRIKPISTNDVKNKQHARKTSAYIMSVHKMQLHKKGIVRICDNQCKRNIIACKKFLFPSPIAIFTCLTFQNSNPQIITCCSDHTPCLTHRILWSMQKTTCRYHTNTKAPWLDISRTLPAWSVVARDWRSFETDFPWKR